MIGSVPLDALSVANLTIGGGDPVALVEAAGAAGFGAVGLVLRTATGRPLGHEVVGRPETVRAIKRACAATGVRVLDVEAFVLTPGADLAAYRAALAVGAELGATHVSAIGTEWIGNTAFLSPGERVDLFGRLCEEAAGFGLHVGVEFMLYRDVRTLGEALALIEAAGRPNAGAIFDVLHFHRAGGAPAELAAAPPGRIAYVQLCDAREAAPPLEGLAVEARTDRLHLGDGVIPLHAILDAAPAGVPLVIETPVRADADLPPAERIRRSAAAAEHFFAGRRG